MNCIFLDHKPLVYLSFSNKIFIFSPNSLKYLINLVELAECFLLPGSATKMDLEIESDEIKKILNTNQDLRTFEIEFENEFKSVENKSIQDYISESQNIGT